MKASAVASMEAQVAQMPAASPALAKRVRDLAAKDDLTSRLAWGLVLHLEALDENDKLAALQLRAQQRGFELPTDVGQFLLRRCPRDTPSLFALLDRLDQASLAAQRKLTIPFVRELI